jgi:hypothetical protein
MIGDITLTVTSPDALKRLERCATRYEDAVRRFGLAYSALSDSRNVLAGEVYERRKDLQAAIAGIRGEVFQP